MIPLALTDTKLYAEWDGSGVTCEALDDWLAGQPRVDSPQAYQLGARTVRRYIMKSSVVEAAPRPAPRWTVLRRLWRAGEWRT
jgi:hypothetical protein